MGWRIGFGVGPLRWSTRLGGRRRSQGAATPDNAPAMGSASDYGIVSQPDRRLWLKVVIGVLVALAPCLLWLIFGVLL